MGANFYTLDDLLLPSERRYEWIDETLSSDSARASHNVLRDIDDLNYDIAHAALKLLKRQKSTVFDRLNDSQLNFEKALKTRPACRFEVFPQTVTSSSSSGHGSVQVDVVLDIAHNEAAISTLSNKAQLLYRHVPTRYESSKPTLLFLT